MSAGNGQPVVDAYTALRQEHGDDGAGLERIRPPGVEDGPAWRRAAVWFFRSFVPILTDPPRGPAGAPIGSVRGLAAMLGRPEGSVRRWLKEKTWPIARKAPWPRTALFAVVRWLSGRATGEPLEIRSMREARHERSSLGEAVLVGGEQLRAAFPAPRPAWATEGDYGLIADAANWAMMAWLASRSGFTPRDCAELPASDVDVFDALASMADLQPDDGADLAIVANLAADLVLHHLSERRRAG